MSFSCETLHIAHKSHLCAMCFGNIAPKSQYWRMAGKWNGDFCAGKAHRDCKHLWEAAYPIYADTYYDGMVWDLAEALYGDEGEDIRQAELNRWRGKFPHVICRIELRRMKSAWRHIDRMRSEGFDYHPEPHEELYA